MVEFIETFQGSLINVNMIRIITYRPTNDDMFDVHCYTDTCVYHVLNSKPFKTEDECRMYLRKVKKMLISNNSKIIYIGGE